jgi:hypothetical protein
MEVFIKSSLTSALDWGGWSTLGSRQSTPVTTAFRRSSPVQNYQLRFCSFFRLGMSHAVADNYFLLHNELNLINFIFKVTVCTSPLISGSLSPRNSAFLGCGWRNGLQIWRVAANILNKQSRTADKVLSSSFGVARSANNCSLPESNHVTNCCKKPRN